MRVEQQLAGKEISRGTVWQLAGDWLSVTSNSDWRKNTHLLGEGAAQGMQDDKDRSSHRMTGSFLPCCSKDKSD